MNARAAAPVQERLIVVEESRVRRDEPAAQPLVVKSADANALLGAITAAASNPHIDVSKVERLFAMHQAVVQQQAEAAFNDAMARTQAKIQPIATDRENDHTHSRYATLKAINREIVPIYSAEGLAVSYDTETKNDADPIPQGEIRTVAWVTHAAGHKKRYHLDLPPDDVGTQGRTNKTKVQAKGSTNEYARRYLMRMIFNIATGDDKDGNSVEGKNKERAQAKDEGQDDSGPAIYPHDRFLKNLPEWKRLIESGEKTAAQIITTVGSKHRLSGDQLQKIRAAEGAKK